MIQPGQWITIRRQRAIHQQRLRLPGKSDMAALQARPRVADDQFVALAGREP